MTCPPATPLLRRVCGAVAAGPTLFIVSLKWDRQSGFVLDQAATRIFELEARDTAAIRLLDRQVTSLIAKTRIRHLALHYRPDTKQFRQHPHVLKIEAMLQLIPGLTVDLVAGASVSAWINREDPPLPGFAEPAQAKLQRGAGIKAIETAAFMAWFANDPRYFATARGYAR